MLSLKEVDSVEIFVLVDNVSDPFTVNDSGVYWNESQFRSKILNIQKYGGQDCCRACNGLSLLFRFSINNQITTLLFDTGPSKDLAVTNARRMGIDLSEVDTIMISHGHFDHFGGINSILDEIHKVDIPIYAHPEVFIETAYGDTQQLTYTKDLLIRDEIVQRGGKIVETTQPTLVLNDAIVISGEVPRVTSYEKGLPDEYKYIDSKWHQAPDVIDEQCIYFNLKNAGTCIITGCGHTGIVNAVKHADKIVNSDNIFLLMGGFHLAGPSFMERVHPTIEDIKLINPDYIITGHCTGRYTQAEFSKVFSKRHIPYAVGARFKF